MPILNYPTEKNFNLLNDDSIENAISKIAAGNPYWQSSKSGRDLYDTQVGKFLRGGRRTNLMTGKNKIVNGMDDPSFLAFSFGITNTDQAGLFGDDISLTKDGKSNMLLPLNKDRSYSALTYLKNAIGNPDGGSEGKRQIFPNEYNELTKFVKGFKTITNKHPYMFQTIDGLTDAYKLYINMHKDAMLGGGKETKIKITCLESMDLRMAALFDSYFQSVYNHQFRRMNIPNNLLRFDCWVLLHDMRNVAQDIASEIGPIRTITPQITQGIISHLSTVLFLFKNCTFNVDEIGATFDSISNRENNETKFTFTFNYGDIEVAVNSLADVYENGKVESAADNTYATATDIITLNNDALLKRSKTKDFDNDMYDPNYGTNLDIGGTLKKIGSTIFHYATSGNAMGNVYDESWAGILSNIMSTITNASTSSIINSVFQTGRMHAMNAISNRINNREEQTSSDTDYGLNGNAYQNGRGDSPWSETPQNDSLPQTTDLGSIDMEESDSEGFDQDNVYDEIPASQELIPDNVYTVIPSSQELIPDNVYGNIQPYQSPLMNEYIDISTSPSNNLNVINVYQVSQYNPTLPSGNVYGGTPVQVPYYGEMADMTSHSQTGVLVAESIDTATPNQSVMENGNVYNEVGGKHSKADFHINVYDRIVESITNPMPIEKIFGTPRPPKKLQKEMVFPLIREGDKGKRKNNIGNVYAKTQERKTDLGNENVHKK